MSSGEFPPIITVLHIGRIADGEAAPLGRARNKVFPQGLMVLRSFRIDLVLILSSFLNKHPLPVTISIRKGP